MAFAGVSATTIRVDLKSCPGGFVELRRMTYGEKLERQNEMKLSLELGKGKDLRGEMAMANKAATQRDFKNCIMSHNLEKDTNGTPFDFSNPYDVLLLDPRVGEEIDAEKAKQEAGKADAASADAASSE